MDNFKGCLFVGDTGLFKVYCDFLVLCIMDTDRILQGDVVTVTDVKTSKTGRIVFEINGSLYYHSYFILYDRQINHGI